MAPAEREPYQRVSAAGGEVPGGADRSPRQAYGRATGWLDVAAALLRRRSTIVTVVVVAVMTATTMLVVESPTYEASARLMVRFDVAEAPVSADDRVASIVTAAIDQRINDVVAMVSSPALVRAVLSEMPARVRRESRFSASLAWLSYPLRYPGILYRRLHEVPASDDLDEATAELLEDLDVERIEASGIVEVSYSGEDPMWSADFVNRLVSKYTQRADHVMEQDTAVRFFLAQRDRLAEQRREAQANLLAFRERHGAALTAQDEQELRAEREKLATVSATMKSELAGVIARVVSLETERRELASSDSHDSEVELSESIEAFKSYVAELEIERSELTARYVATSPVVRDIDKRVEKARALLDQERRTLAASLATSGPGIQELDLELIRDRARRSQLGASIDALADEIATYDDRISRIERLSIERERLRTELAIAEEAYSTYLRKEETARFSMALHESNITNITVIDWAVAPSAPERSNMTARIVAIALLSLVMGCGLALLRDRIDPTLASAAEAEAIADLRVVAALPAADGAALGAASLRGRLRLGEHRWLMLLLLAGLPAGAAFAMLRPAAHLATPGGRVSRAPQQTAAVVLATGETSGIGVRELEVVRRANIEAAPVEQQAPRLEAERPSSREAQRPEAPALELAEAVVHGAAGTVAGVAAPLQVSQAVELRAGRLVEVERGATLYSMMRAQYSAFTPELVALVRAANPSLVDATRIRAGEVLRFPEVIASTQNEERQP